MIPLQTVRKGLMEMDDIFLKKCTEADADILRSLLAKTFSDTFARMNTPENMELYLTQAFARDRMLEELRDQDSAFYLLYQNDRPAIPILWRSSRSMWRKNFRAQGLAAV